MIVNMYMYPDDLKEKPILWLWYLSDIGIIGVGAILSVILINQANFYVPFALVGCYAFMSIRLQNTSIFDFFQYACVFFIFQQQFYVWSYTNQKDICQDTIKQQKNKVLKFWR